MCQYRIWEDLGAYTGQIVRLDPEGFPDAWFKNAIANLNLRRLDAAEASILAAMKLDPEGKSPRNEYILALILAGKNELESVLAHLRHYIQSDSQVADMARVKQQLDVLEREMASRREAHP